MATTEPTTRDVILITGASGLIGSRLCERLADRYTLVGMDVASPRDDLLPIDHIDADLTEDASVARALELFEERHGRRIASVIHLAAHYDFSGEPSPLYQQLTVDGTRRLLRGLHDRNVDVEQFVFASSLLVMEPCADGELLTENSPTRAEWAYPQSKLDAENVIRAEHGEIPIVILRIAGVYDDQCHSLPVSQQIARIYEEHFESYVFPGNTSHGQALVHLDDLAMCFEQTIAHRSQLGKEELFLVAEPDAVSYEDLQERIGELLHGSDWPTLRIPKVVAKAGAYAEELFADDSEEQFIKPWMIDLADDHYEPKFARARENLDWEPEHRLRETLPAMINSLRANPRQFYEENGLPIPNSFPAPTNRRDE